MSIVFSLIVRLCSILVSLTVFSSFILVKVKKHLTSQHSLRVATVLRS